MATNETSAMSLQSGSQADPAGDLTLLVGSGEDQISIRVSSKVLTLASPIFAAMLSPNVAEGQALSQKTAGVIPSVPMPDDDPEAMKWLCDALHHKQILETRMFKFPVLKKMAVLCDKYDMSIALGPWTHLWMQKWAGSVGGVDRFPDILWISYAFGHHRIFWKASRDLMCLYTAEGLLCAANDLTNGILPDRILGKWNLPVTNILVSK